MCLRIYMLYCIHYLLRHLQVDRPPCIHAQEGPFMFSMKQKVNGCFLFISPDAVAGMSESPWVHTWSRWQWRNQEWTVSKSTHVQYVRKHAYMLYIVRTIIVFLLYSTLALLLFKPPRYIASWRSYELPCFCYVTDWVYARSTYVRRIYVHCGSLSIRGEKNQTTKRSYTMNRIITSAVA